MDRVKALTSLTDEQWRRVLDDLFWVKVGMHRALGDEYDEAPIAGIPEEVNWAHGLPLFFCGDFAYSLHPAGGVVELRLHRGWMTRRWYCPDGSVCFEDVGLAGGPALPKATLDALGVGNGDPRMN